MLRVCELFGKQFAICLGVVAILLLNIMEVFSVAGVALLDRPCMVFQRMCVLAQCATKCSFHRCCLFCISEIISSFKRLEADHRCLLSFICCFFV